METTLKYFNLTMDQAVLTNEYGYTKEENKLFDEGLKVVFFDSMEELEQEKQEFNNYLFENDFTVKTVLKTINERIAVVLY